MVKIWRNGCNRTESLAIMYKPKRIWSYILLHHIKSLLYCLSMIYFSFKYIFLVAKRIELFILLFFKKNVLAKNFHLCFYHFFFFHLVKKGGNPPYRRYVNLWNSKCQIFPPPAFYLYQNSCSCLCTFLCLYSCSCSSSCSCFNWVSEGTCTLHWQHIFSANPL